ncbi:MAG: BON domain-containing protein [Gemmatimonadaceae bacterium]
MSDHNRWNQPNDRMRDDNDGDRNYSGRSRGNEAGSSRSSSYGDEESTSAGRYRNLGDRGMSNRGIGDGNMSDGNMSDRSMNDRSMSDRSMSDRNDWSDRDERNSGAKSRGYDGGFNRSRGRSPNDGSDYSDSRSSSSMGGSDSFGRNDDYDRGTYSNQRDQGEGTDDRDVRRRGNSPGSSSSNQFGSGRNNPSDMRSNGNFDDGSWPGSAMNNGNRDRSTSQTSRSAGNQWMGSAGMDSSMQRGQHAGRGPKGYKRDDNRVTEDVNEALTHDAHIDASEIEVKVSNGDVTLSGTVDSREAKRHAEDIAERVSGVTDVNNQIRVTKGNSGKSDSWNTTKNNSDTDSDKQADGFKTSAKSTPGTDKTDSALSGASTSSASSSASSGKSNPSTSGAAALKSGERSSNN